MLGNIRRRDDLLKLKHLNSDQVIEAMNVEKVVVVPKGDINDLQDDKIDLNKPAENDRTKTQVSSYKLKVAFQFGKYLLTKKTIVLLHQTHANK